MDSVNKSIDDVMKINKPKKERRMKINPFATGNKTTSGIIGSIVVSMCMPIVFKIFHIEDTDGQLMMWAIGVSPTAGLAIVGALHKLLRTVAAAGGFIPYIKMLWDKYVV